jgi:DNA-binding NarL/FixJ family response regulator
VDSPILHRQIPTLWSSRFTISTPLNSIDRQLYATNLELAMSADNGSLPADPVLKIMLIDDDAVFRLGLKIWLDRFTDLDVVADAETGADALQVLETKALKTDATGTAPKKTVDLIILELSLGRTNSSQMQGLTLCQQLRVQYPQIPVLILSALTAPVMLAAAQQAGAAGYCAKNLEVAELVDVIRQVAIGQSYWLPPLATRPSNAALPQEAPQVELLKPSPLAVLRRNLRRSGIQRIEAALADVTAQLQNLDLSIVDRAVLAGRQRELRAARWLVGRLLATPALPLESPVSEAMPSERFVSTPTLENRIQISQNPSDLVVAPIAPPIASAKTLQAVLWDRVLAKLPTSLQNQTDQPLEIDILRQDKRRELLYLVLRKLEDLLDELRFSQVNLNQLFEKRISILQDLWQAVVIEFYGKYSTVQVNNSQLEVAEVLQQDIEIVTIAILNKIPLAIDLTAHLLFQTPLLIDGNSFNTGSPEALARAEILLENLLIQVANAVVQPLLNRFAKVETIQQNFYDQRLMSIREVERFRNSLSWKYRLEQSINEPKAIFESRYRLLIFYNRGIDQTSIYAPRNQELELLSGIPFVITLMLETRDAIAPRLRTTLSFFGAGIIYVLTEVIGRGLGLVGRGILKGVGSVRSDRGFNQDSDRSK